MDWHLDKWDRSRLISFAACQYLRHARGGVELRSDGSFSIRRLAEKPALHIQRCSEAELYNFVENCELDTDGKRRYELVLDETGYNSPCARACQGHNIRAQGMIDRWRMMPEIYPGHARWPKLGVGAHGTYRQYVPSIKANGLRAGGIGGRRSDNHLVAQVNTTSADQPGLRSEADTIVFVDMDAHYEAGGKWFITNQNVILTSQTIQNRYIKSIVDRWSGNPVYTCDTPEVDSRTGEILNKERDTELVGDESN